jgi:hypothetical protein
VEVFILLFFVALCCLAVILSVSASSRRSSLPHRSTEQSPPRFIELQYDMLGGRLKHIGNIEIQYDMLGGRPKWLGDIELQYDMLGGRPKYIVTMNNNANLNQQNLITIFFVLYERTRKIKAASN